MAQVKKGIADWNTEEVVAWIEKEYADNEARKRKLVKAVREDGYTGAELLSCKNAAELQKELEIKKEKVAESLFKKMMAVKDGAIQDMVDDVTKKLVDKEKPMTPEDLDCLIKVFEGLFPIKRADDIKENESKDSGNEFGDFIKMIKEIGASTKDFVKSLIGLKIKKSVTEEIIEICFDYYKLLTGTASRFAEYGADIHKLTECMSQISHLYLLPSSIKKDLDKLDDISKKKAINKVREQTSKGLKSSCKHFHTLLGEIDKRHVPNLKQLSDEWLQLNKRIIKLLAVLKEHKSKMENKSDTNEKYENVNGILNGVRGVAELAGGFCLKYLDAPLTFGLPYALSAVNGAAVGAGIFLCATGMGIPLGGVLIAGGTVSQVAVCKTEDKMHNAANKMYNKGDSMMNKGGSMINESFSIIKKRFSKLPRIEKTENDIQQIEIMKGALQRMATIAERMSTTITLEVNNFDKIKEFDPHNAITYSGGGCGEADVIFMNQDILKKVQELGQSILNCTTFLGKSRENINIVETVCEEEMKLFGKYVQTPLLRMLDSNSNSKE